MAKTISSTITGSYTLSGNPTTILATGAVLASGFPPALYGPVGTAWTLINSGQIVNSQVFVPGVSLASGGNVTNTASGGITGGGDGIHITGGPGTIVNAGGIAGAFPRAGVYLAAGGIVTNLSGGSIGNEVGLLDGIWAGAFATTVTNAGTVTAVGGAAIGVDLLGRGSVINQSGGTISAYGGSAMGISLQAGGTAINRSGGTVGGRGGAAVGIDLPAGGILINQSSGTISGYGGDAVVVAGAGTVVNAGTLTATNAAVMFNGTFANRLVIDPGAVFIGTVIGAHSPSTLELASGASSGTITNFGSQFGSFGTIAFDPGADWFISSDPAGVGGLITGFNQGDTIQIAGLTAASSAFSNGVLTLTGSGSVTSATLDLAGSLSLANFDVANVSGGVDVSLNTPNPTAPVPLLINLASNASYTIAEPNQTVFGSGGGTTINLQASTALFYADGGSDTVTTTGINDTVQGAEGSATVNAAGGSAVVIGGTGAQLLNIANSADTILGGSGALTVFSGVGGSPLVFDGAAPLFFSGGSGAATVIGGGGADTVFANGGGGQFWGGSGNMLFVGGSGVSTAVGGSGSSTLFGGSSGADLLVAGLGSSTLVGSSGNVLVGLGRNQDALVSGGGNETLVGSAGGGNDLMFANNGSDVMFGGTGNDIFVASHGNTQMIGGTGPDVFVFDNGAAGGSDVIWNFVHGQDVVGLFGYGANTVQMVLGTAVVTAGSTTVRLPDNTRITFANVANLSASDVFAG